MAGNTRRNWSTDDLQAVVSVIKMKKISLKRAETVKPRLTFLVVNIVFGVIVSYIVFVCTTILDSSVYAKVTGSPYILSENGILYYVYGG